MENKSPLELMNQFVVVFNDGLEDLRKGRNVKDRLLGMIDLADSLGVLGCYNADGLKAKVNDEVSELEYNKWLEDMGCSYE